MKRLLLAFLPVFLLSLAPSAYSANAEAAQPFALIVVPSFSSPEDKGITMGDKPKEFYVVLTNNSTASQPVFEHWNSWGFYTISFELTTPDGKKVVIVPGPHAWTVNFPSTFLIPAGEHQVFPILLDQQWTTRPQPALDGGAKMQITLKAIYEVASTPEAADYKVWTGRIESKPYKFTLRHNPK